MDEKSQLNRALPLELDYSVPKRKDNMFVTGLVIVAVLYCVTAVVLAIRAGDGYRPEEFLTD